MLKYQNFITCHFELFVYMYNHHDTPISRSALFANY